MLESPAMKMALALAAAVLAGPLAAQEAPRRPMFPPVEQILGESPAAGPRVKPADFDSLIVRLNAPDAQTRRQAAAALGRRDNVRAVPFLGATLLKINEAADVRVAAAMALGRIGSWRCETFLRQSITDPSRDVRFASALALGKAKTAGSVDLLSTALAQDRDWWVRYAAAVGLADNRAPQSVAALAGAAKTDAKWQVRMQAVRSLGLIGSRDAALALDGPLHDRDAGVRAAAALALGDIGGLDALHELVAALHGEAEDFPRQMMADSIRKLLSSK